MKMNLVVFVTVLSAFSLFASAQSSQQQGNYRLKVEKYNKMKKAGILLIAAGGGIAIIVGVSRSGHKSNATLYSSGANTQQTTVLDGLAVGAIACLGTGIPLAIVGSAVSQKYKRKLEATSVHLNLTPQAQGIGFSYRF